VGAGTVVGAGYLADEGGYGQIVLVRHRGGVITAYAHMSKVLVHAGERVRAGEVIGKVGSTGHVTGPHLHFEVRIGGQKVNPVPWLRRHGVSV
ncbi:MAG: M23 family metallopeptidase, partial [Actinomycetota bacterium]|nr:M23 family metallopeptidase [Actinomycetota bacterium]